MAEIHEWFNKTLSEHEALLTKAAKGGYRFLSLSLYGTPSSPLYAATMIKTNPTQAQRAFSHRTLNEIEQGIAAEKADGFGPIIISATGPADSPVFAAVFAPLVAGAVTHLALSDHPGSTSTSTIQGQMAKNKSDGRILKWAASYGDSDDRRFAAIWQPQGTDKYLWNADGVDEPGETYQQRFDAQTSVWSRPYFVTLNRSLEYCSAFVAQEVGGYHARHGLDAHEYSNEYTKWVKKKKFTPVCVQAAGDDVDSARFAAIFTQQLKPIKRQFQANGPVANEDIDAVIEKALRDSPLREAALAIVHDKKLVYARGYTLAEPDWPAVEPTTCFRMASDSKTVTALAAYQLIQEGKLNLGDSVQNILKLKTPSGNKPTDTRFNDITIGHLLAHTSGLQPHGYGPALKVRDAFIQAGHPNKLPVSNAQTECYVASLPLVTKPGTKQVYNNCGYYLLGRAIMRLRKASSAVEAFENHLLKVLNVSRIRGARTLIQQQHSDEARYQTSALSVAKSIMSDAQQLVADGYGNLQMEIMESAGGLSGAATDIARLIAIMISQDDNPAMPRSTLVDMLNNAIATKAMPGYKRAGHGWDEVKSLGSGKYYAQKGGSIATDHSVIEFDGDWGFTMLWAGEAAAAAKWYPDYPSVMKIARKASWTTDLFPQFGMPSL